MNSSHETAGSLFPPAVVADGWPAPNYRDPATLGSGPIVLCSIVCAVAVSVVACRLFARFFLLKNHGLDDWLIAASIPFTVSFLILIAVAEQVRNFNRHVWDVPKDDLVYGYKIVLISEVLYGFASGFVRLSILFFYRRLARASVSGIFKLALWLCILFVLLYMSICIPIIVCTCSPISAFWNGAAGVGTSEFVCRNEGVILLIAGSLSVVQDTFAAFLPPMLVWPLQIPAAQRRVLILLLAAGCLAGVVGIVRIYYTYKIFYDTYDISYYGPTLWTLSLVEICIGLICASMPALRALLKRPSAATA